MSETNISETGGQRLVLALYGVVVLLAGLIGFALGIIGPEGLDPVLFGLLPLPPTPVGTAVYGAVTVGTLLGVLLLAVVAVSERYPDA